MLWDTYLVLVLCVFNKYLITGYLTWIKPYNHVMLSNPKHVITLPYYVAIINGIFPHRLKEKETTNPYEMEIKYKIFLHKMTWAEADEIEYNTIGVFQTSDSNTLGYYIVRWIGNKYNLQE